VNEQLHQIKAFHAVDGRVGTSGMPGPADFESIAQAGYRTVVNLALPTSDNAVPNEGELVAKARMTYIHIPVLFDAPAAEDFLKFTRVMDALKDERVFVHCAANMRVSAFLFLYRLHQGSTSRAKAEADLIRIWNPDAIWKDFINKNLPSGEKPF
jgi:protein tyrosine phosphatase (PTP) superfamily phosphohydrolase (DUF442 family)